MITVNNFPAINQNLQNQSKEILTYEDTMSLLRIKNRKTLKGIIDRHEIGYYKNGRRYLFSTTKHITPYLRKLERKATA